MCNYNRLNFKQIALVSGEALLYILFVYIQMLNIFLPFSVSVYCNKYTFSNSYLYLYCPSAFVLRAALLAVSLPFPRFCANAVV